VYVLKREDQEEILQRLTLTEVTDDGWTRKYRHPLTGEIWSLYYVYGELQGGGFPVLRKEPLPERLSDRLSTAFASGREDDVVGLAWDLSSEHEKWSEVLDWLEAKRGSLSTEAVASFIRCLSVLMPINRRPTLGKHYVEVVADHNHFLGLAERARRLIGVA
jgi:hypothetical protein